MKSLLTKKQISTISKDATKCVYLIEELLASIEKEKESNKVCFPSLFNLYWIDNEWITHGKGFEGKPPKTKNTTTKKDVILYIYDKTDFPQKEIAEIISKLDKIIIDRISACRAKVEKFDFFGRGELTVEKGKISFSSYNQLSSENTSDYIKKLSLQAGEGFTKEKGANLCELDPEMCTIILSKVGSRLVRKNGQNVGIDVDQFIVPKDVKHLDSQSLAILSKHRGYLGLDSLTAINAEEAKAISNYQGIIFRFVHTRLTIPGNNPCTLRCGYTLSNVESLTEEAARELSNFDNSKNPPWWDDLASERKFRWDAKKVHSDLIVHNFSGIKKITPETLAHLANLHGHLDLNGLEAFDDDHAKALRNHKGGVSLKGVSTISIDTAMHLSEMVSWNDNWDKEPYSSVSNENGDWGACIDLCGLKNLELEKCAALINTKKRAIHLGHFDTLTKQLASLIMDSENAVLLTYDSYEDEAKEMLSQRRDFEEFND